MLSTDRCTSVNNYPVNDVFMSEVLHIGPYPQRDVGAADRVRGVFVNFMETPLVSRIGLACAAASGATPRPTGKQRGVMSSMR